MTLMPPDLADATATAVRYITLMRDRDFDAMAEALTDLVMHETPMTIAPVINALALIASSVPADKVSQFALVIQGMRDDAE